MPAQVVLQVCNGSGRAGQGLRHRPSVALKRVPAHTLPNGVLGVMEGDSEKVGGLVLWETSATGFCR